MVSEVLATHRVGVRRPDLLSVKRLVELLAKVVILCLEIIVLAKKAKARFVASLVCGIRDGNISQWRGRTTELKLLEFLSRWLEISYTHVAFKMLHGLSVILFG